MPTNKRYIVLWRLHGCMECDCNPQ